MNAEPKSIKVRQEQIIQRRAEVWRLRTEEGMSHSEIARLMNVNQATIARDLKTISQELAGDMKELALREKVIQIFQLQAIVRESISAWQDSKQPKKEIKKDVISEYQPVLDSKTGELISNRSIPTGEKVTTKITQTGGDPVYLQKALEAMGALRDMLGMDEPKRSLNVNWQQELKDLGVDPSNMFEQLVQSAYTAISDKSESGEG